MDKETKYIATENYDIPIDEFVKQPDVVSLIAIYSNRFRTYVKDKPYIKVGTVLAGEYVIAYTKQDMVEQVVEDLGLGYVNSFVRILGLLGKESLDSAGISRVHNQPFLYLKGEGVLVGFIDTGIDYTKPTFIYEDGTTKIKYLWDQTLEGAPPNEMHFGAVFTDTDINEALKAEDPYSIVPSKDENGHGTFLASVAAGHEQNEYLGAAPNSDIVVVKLRKAKEYYIEKFLIPQDQNNVFDSNDVLLGIHFLVALASKLNRPLAICLGLGTTFGAHNGFSFFEQYLSILSRRAGLVFCVGAGNESNAKHHANGIFKKEGEKQTIPIKVGENVKSFSVSIWSVSYDKIAVGVKSPTGEIIDKSPIQPGYTFTKQLILEKTTITVEYYEDSNSLSVVRFIDPTPGIWDIEVYADSIVLGEYHAYLPLTGLVSPNVEFLTPNPNYTITIPGTAFDIITCGAYDMRDNSLYVSSSWGPTTAPRISPDLLSPGVNVRGVTPSGYSMMSGTSVAAAVTAGACALVLQWGMIERHDPGMNSNRVRALLIRGCERDKNVEYPNNQYGYGRLNLYQTFNKLRES